jgi:4-alpha-glucanotransferase
MSFQRSSGVLVHPTSFPNKYGIGSLGKAAYDWLDWLESAGQKLWQILPLGHTGYGDSPYQSFSASAGNPLLIDLELLVSEGLLEQAVLDAVPNFPPYSVDYGWVYVWKWDALRATHAGYRDHATPTQRTSFEDFRKTNADWLEDYALFMACKGAHGGKQWTLWATDLVHREPAALEQARNELEVETELYAFVQWLFFTQWNAVKAAAHTKNIRIVGDIPIFVAHDSSDVWAKQHLFALEPDGNPSVVAGVPPDYFSETGQLWGNPHYRWNVMAQDGFAWWLERFRATLESVDVVRVDHFRGFDAYWEVPGNAENAIGGRWVKAPGFELFKAVQAKFGDLPIIAEDLGVITPEVEALRDGFNLPGMKILQFAFYGDNSDPFLPHNYNENCVVYSGTHDNDTSVGWWKSEPESVQHKVRDYLHTDGSHIAWDLINAAWRSRAVMSIAPLQDFLELDTEARMNLPGGASGWWSWRYDSSVLRDDLAQRIKGLTVSSSR